ncbi:chromatin assembly factor 1 subunit A-domain-containing protein [Gloeopeniophorella convolvens]|nr:chromatin assembly factor 1 subunit A-domain-containing protein [Gloeopeniophorella convolvens]
MPGPTQHTDVLQNTPPSDPQVKTGHVGIKNGKVVFKQKPMSFEKMTETMQEMVNFREWLEKRMENREPPLTEIPEEHRPLISKFTQESDKTIAALSKYIQQELVPDDDDDVDNSASILPLSAVEGAVKLMARRVNYGVESPLTKTPAALSVWRWELKEEYLGFLPRASREKVDARSAERLQYKKDLQAIFDALPAAERNTLLGMKDSATTTPAKPQPLHRASSNDATPTRNDVSGDKPLDKAAAAGSGENPGSARKPGRPKAPVDPERAAKEKERLDKKAAKAEKEKKEKEAQEKARSIMANFFGKPKASPSTSTSPFKGSAASSSSSNTVMSEFDRVFKPFLVKKEAELAPTNWFRDAKRRRRHANANVIIIDDDGKEMNDVEMAELQPSPDASPRTHIRRLLATCPSVPLPSRSSEPVRSVVARLTEAEVSDDTATVRALLSQLRDRAQIPAKVLIFREDERPGYFGTFTKRSRLIKPRKPFARDDVALDYAYDSGAEWGEEEEGGGDDVLGDSDEERDDDEGSDDLDDWLVDGEDEEAVTPIEEREGLDAFPFPPLPEAGKSKRKAAKEAEAGGDASKTKKRKVVVPLVPFVKGPCWESEIGKCEYEPFEQYRIQLFNDTPYPLDPFTFASTPVNTSSSVVPPAASASAAKSGPQFVVPALPPHIAAPITGVLDLASTQQVKRPRVVPKNPFPDAHLPFLKEKVASMGTSSLIALVEALYIDLKTHKVKKNAIEAKVREICVKDQRHIWSVKSGDAEVRAP